MWGQTGGRSGMESKLGDSHLGQDLGGGVLTLHLAEGAAGLSLRDLGDIAQAIVAAGTDKALGGVILDLRGAQAAPPQLADVLDEVCLAIENSARPVVACLDGMTGGAIWAIALAAHYRFASENVQVVMSEARFGLMPGGGATQRLPRLIGAADSIGMILGAKAHSAQELCAFGAVDRVVDAPVSAAQQALAEGLLVRRTRDAGRGLRDAKRFLTEVRAFAGKGPRDPLDVSNAVVRCVEAALLLPFAQGLAFESVVLEDLFGAPQTRAFGHALRVERAARDDLRALAGRLSELGGGQAAKLGLWRAGRAQAGLVLAALGRGMAVVIADPDPERLAALTREVAAAQMALLSSKALSEEARDADWARLQSGGAAEALIGCDLILTGQADLPPAIGPAAHLGHWGEGPRLLPAPAIGGHAEMILGARESASEALVLDLARRLGWRLTVAGPQFIAPNLREVQQAAVQRLGEMGYSAADIAAGMASVGMGRAPKAAEKVPYGAVYDAGQMALAAVANEAARLMAGGAAHAVDAAALGAGIMPRWMGGPLYQADLRGLILLRADLACLGGAGRLAPSAALERMISEGRRFYP